MAAVAFQSPGKLTPVEAPGIPAEKVFRDVQGRLWVLKTNDLKHILVRGHLFIASDGKERWSLEVRKGRELKMTFQLGAAQTVTRHEVQSGMHLPTAILDYLQSNGFFVQPEVPGRD